MKRIFCLLMSVMMGLGLLSGCGGSQSKQQADSTPDSTPTESIKNVDDEIQRAIELGLVPKSLQGDYETQISYEEYCAILDCYFEIAAPDAFDRWKNSSSNYHDAKDKMTLMEGILVLFQAAQDSNMDAQGYQYNIPMQEGAQWLDYPLLGNIEAIDYYDEDIANSEDYKWVNDQIYPNIAAMFATRFSFGNGKTYFDLNSNFTFDYHSMFTREAAIKSVKRLCDTTFFSTYIPVEEITCGVTEEAISLGEKLPVATYDNLPDWRGYCLTTRAYNLFSGVGKNYDEEEIKLIADLGFNMIRAQVDYRDVFAGEDMSRVCKEMISNMDNLVNLCAKYGLHLCYDLTDMQGFTTDTKDFNDDLFTNPETQEHFRSIWAFMAEHYQDVPANLLSFLLLNEPHDADELALTDENYSRVMRMAINAIHSISPERVIIVSTLGAHFSTPAEGLADAQVAFGCSGYPLSDNAKQWPAYYIGKNHQEGSGDLVLNGDFEAGTQVSLSIMQYITSSLTLYADGNSVVSFEIDGNVYDGTGLNLTQGDAQIFWEGSNGGVYGMYTVTFELSNPCKELRVKNKDDAYYEMWMCNVTTPENCYTINGAWDFDLKWEKDLVLELNADGSISSKTAEGLFIRDKDTLKELVQKHIDYRERTGSEFMILEFGFMPSIPTNVAVNAADDWFAVFKEYDIPWIGYCNEHGPFMDSRKADMIPLISDPNSGDISWYRQDSSYENVSDYYIIDTELMAVYQKYMNM